MTLKEDDAVRQFVRVMHFLDGFLTFLLGEPREAPVAQEAVVEPVLIDGAELQK